VTLFLIGLGILLVGGLLSLLAHRLAVIGAVAGCTVSLISAVRVLAGGATETLRLPWNMPWASFFVEIDPLSAFFLLPILGLSALAAIYGVGYLRGGKQTPSVWFFYNLLVVGMAMVVVARNGVLFLVAWEVMALASFFLVGFEHEKPSVREAAWTYLIAGHLGTAFVLAFFVIVGRETGSLDFDRFGGLAPSLAAPLFLLTVVGFGTKAGFMPLHVWLPEAHPAAPSHVSALMSGVMIKTGVYALLRAIMLLGPPPLWWGWLLIAIGLTSGVLGVLFALAQHDLKRLLAYHSVENMGIIALGIGVGLLGIASGSRPMAVLGFAGGLLHVLNHAIFKGLLFLGAGSVLHATGTREIDEMGGLLKKMPLTGATFLIGAAAISGLPPLNGFVSEFLIALGALSSATAHDVPVAVPALLTLGGLALIGGLAAACFAKAFGIVFLGEPRSDHARHAHEAALSMRVPMFLLAAGCFAIGLLGPFVTRFAAPAIEQVARVPVGDHLAQAAAPLSAVAIGALAFLALLALLATLRLWLLRGRPVGETVTWDCGYARPTARMQYTSSSFAQPLTDLFWSFLRTRRAGASPEGYFPREAALSTETPDVCRERFYRPAFSVVAWGLSRLGWLQQGRVHLYILYIALTLLALLVWKLA
jgi:formate hydrogenlyase subunit 3/multisubunit Na+/H+ antiporter MnhD subunit